MDGACRGGGVDVIGRCRGVGGFQEAGEAGVDGEGECSWMGSNAGESRKSRDFRLPRKKLLRCVVCTWGK